MLFFLLAPYYGKAEDALTIGFTKAATPHYPENKITASCLFSNWAGNHIADCEQVELSCPRKDF